MLIAVCLAFVDQRPQVDALSGEVSTDERAGRLTDADAAALELALSCAQRWGGEVLALTAGPPAADAVLRQALACGVDRAVRLPEPRSELAADVAATLAAASGAADLVWCGDQGPGAGSGAVPAFLAAELGVAGAFGLLEVVLSGAAGHIAAVRRLDGGRRERLAITAPAVLSVEGAVAHLRRAGLTGVLRAERAVIEAGGAGPRTVGPGTRGVHVGPPRSYRPRPRVIAAPPGASALERVRALTGAGAGATAADGERRLAVAADPERAAALILEALDRWGYELPDRAAP